MHEELTIRRTRGRGFHAARLQRIALALGVILLLIGGWFLLNQVNPQFRNFFEPYIEWPVNMLLIGAGILIIGLLTGSPGLAGSPFNCTTASLHFAASATA